MNRIYETQNDDEPQKSRSIEIPALRATLIKTYYAAIRDNQLELETKIIEFIEQLGVDEPSSDIKDNIDILLDYLNIEHNALAAKLICILAYKNENMQRNILSLRSFLKIGSIIYFNLPQSYDEYTIQAVERNVIVPEKSPPRICYLYPESEDLPHYNPEKLVDATIDTKSQFIGFKLNSDSLEKLLQEALKGDLAPITEICSVDNESHHKSRVCSTPSNSHLVTEKVIDNLSEIMNTTQSSVHHSQNVFGKPSSIHLGKTDDSMVKYSSDVYDPDLSTISDNISTLLRQTLKSAGQSWQAGPKIRPEPTVSSRNAPRSNSASVKGSTKNKAARHINFDMVPRPPSQSTQKRPATGYSQRSSSIKNSRDRSFDAAARSTGKSFDFFNPKVDSSFRLNTSYSSSTRRKSPQTTTTNFRGSRLLTDPSDSDTIYRTRSRIHSEIPPLGKVSNISSRFVLQDEKLYEDEQLTTPLSKQIVNILKRTENGKYISYLQKIKEHEKPKLENQEYLNPMGMNIRKSHVSTATKNFLEEYSYYFDPRVQAELRKETSDQSKSVTPLDKMLYMRLAPRTLSSYKWRSQASKNRLLKESVMIPEMDYKYQPEVTPLKALRQRQQREIKVERLWDSKLDDNKRASYLEDEFYLDVTSNLDDYISNLGELKERNEKIFGDKFSYYNDVLQFCDAKGEGSRVDAKEIRDAAQEVKYLLDWKQGKIPPDQAIGAIPKKVENKKKEKDPLTLQEDYFPRKPAVVERTGLVVESLEDPEEFLKVKRRGSIRKATRGKKTFYPLLDSSPLMSPTPEGTALNSPTLSAKKSHYEPTEFKLVPTRL